jgi:hypothetical protein
VGPRMKRRKLKLKAKLESGLSNFSFNRLFPAFRRFQLRFYRFNLHRLTKSIVSGSTSGAMRRCGMPLAAASRTINKPASRAIHAPP